MIVSDTSSTDGLDVMSKEHGARDLRPSLNITYDVPTVTVPDTLHVSNIAMELKPAKRKQAFARATVTMYDQYGDPVAGATVNATWSGVVGNAVSASTDASGNGVLDSDLVGRGVTGEFRLTVSSAALNGYDYDDSADVESEDCIMRVNAGSTQSADCGGGGGEDPPALVSVDSDAVAVSLSRKGKNWAASIAIHIVDGIGGGSDALANVTDDGVFTFNGGQIGASSGVTNGSGDVSFNSPKEWAGSGDQFCFEITALSYSNPTGYDPEVSALPLYCGAVN